MLEEKTVTGMADMMNFPKRWEDFLHDYEFEDARRIYTNGSRLIPSFRVKQMMEHYAPVVHGRWKCNKPCPVCGRDRFEGLDADIWADWEPPYCPNCGADMRGSNDE